MAQEQNYGSGKIKLTFSEKIDILKPYISSRFMDQLKSVWIIITYLVLFQIVILQLPIVYSLMIGFGVFIVILGLMFFIEGLMLGLMPFGEILGAKLPVKSTLPVILLFAFLLGMGATFAEPAIAVLKLAGAGVKAEMAPLLYSLLNEFSGQLVFSVGMGVGLAVLLGVLRFMYGWSLKVFIIPAVLILSALTVWAHFNDTLKPMIGLAWDCGAVTTGPVTVPLVLALGIGVCRVVNTGDSGSAGFGIVTLASLFPILAVLLLGAYHFYAEDYYGANNSKQNMAVETSVTAGKSAMAERDFVVNKKETGNEIPGSVKKWDSTINAGQMFVESFLAALQAIIPLCLFLFVMLRFVLREKVPHADEISVGIGFAVIGMAVFGIGISLGLTPLGSQLGSNIPSAFAKIQLWGLDASYGPLFGETS